MTLVVHSQRRYASGYTFEPGLSVVQNDPLVTRFLERPPSTSPAGTEGEDLVFSVRDTFEAQRFYEQIFGRSEMSCSESVLTIYIDGLTITCCRQANLGARGRVAVRYQLVNSGFVPVRHRVSVNEADWRAIAERLPQGGIAYEMYSVSSELAAHSATLRIAVVDPSGNALEIQCIMADARTNLIRRRMTWILCGAVLIAFGAILFYGLWEHTELPRDQYNIGMRFSFH